MWDLARKQQKSADGPLFFWKRDKMQQNNVDRKGAALAALGTQLGYSLTLVSTFCAADAWKSLTDKVQEARSNARLKQLSFAGTLQGQLPLYHTSDCMGANRSVSSLGSSPILRDSSFPVT